MGLRIGGQAVIDGVMMRSSKYISTSVRKSNGKIKTRTRKFISITERHKILGIPFIRGIVMLFELMIMGMKELSWSSNEVMDEEHEKLSRKELVFTIILSLVIGLALFKLLPWFLANFFFADRGAGTFLINLADAVIKSVILVGYLLIITLLPDVKTLWQYHGAEHKAVSCFESGKKMTPRNAQKFTTIHPRCGTTFIFLVFFISMFFYLIIPAGLGFWGNYGVRIMMLPIIAGFAYEIIRLGGMYYEKSAVVRTIMWPGLQFQRITTRQPSLKQLEVSIASLQACMKKEMKS